MKRKNMNQAADILADRIASGFSMEGTDWIPEGATEPAQIEEKAEAEIAPNETLKEQILSIFRHNKVALVSAIIIALFVIVTIAAPLFAPCDPYVQDLTNRAGTPSAQHLLGTDQLGRDVLSRMIYGGRVSLMVGLIPTLISMAIGTVLGLVSGFIGGKIDNIIMRIADVLMAFPSLLLAMLVSYTLGGGMLTIFIALSLAGWAGTARVVRSEVLSLREKEYVEAATSIGVKRSVIMMRHILPNCVPTLVVLFTMNVPGNILTESSLSFLGIGAQPPDPSWGLMVFEMKKYLSDSPVATLAPGIVILILVVAFNFLGDALRDKLDPSLQN
ncbi:MAG: ABC transporter permease [Firmicutes bacterium]|nr:ABC transporter permease [Bacillota bacterium]